MSNLAMSQLCGRVLLHWLELWRWRRHSLPPAALTQAPAACNPTPLSPIIEWQLNNWLQSLIPQQWQFQTSTLPYCHSSPNQGHKVMSSNLLLGEDQDQLLHAASPAQHILPDGDPSLRATYLTASPAQLDGAQRTHARYPWAYGHHICGQNKHVLSESIMLWSCSVFLI